MKDNYYRILGLDNFASDEVIKKSYRKLAKKYHPDKNPQSEEQFKRITLAYKALTDPSQKALHDEWLLYDQASKATSTPRQPNYSQRKSYYTSEKVFYTPTVKMYGVIFTIGLVMVCILGPIAFMYKASDYAYDEGNDFSQKGEYGRAIRSYSRAITYFGQRSGESSISGARIGLYKTREPSQAKFFILKGLDKASDPLHVGELHYLDAMIYKMQPDTSRALAALDTAWSFGYNRDSILMQKAQIKAFYMEDFDQAGIYFDSLLNRNPNFTDALFGRAWTLQRLNKPGRSIKLYDRLIGKDSLHVLGRFYRGHNYIVLGDTIQACKDFQMAYDLGYQPALVYIVNQCQ